MPAWWPMVTNFSSNVVKMLGFVKTYSVKSFYDRFGAGGTALACGVKTKNGMIGMNADSVSFVLFSKWPKKKKKKKNNLATGIVSACAVTHATPASFIAHVADRNMYEEIAAYYLKTDMNVFVGGGRKYFEERTDTEI